MSEIALLSNQSSSLYSSSKASGGSSLSDYVYDMKQSGVNKFTERFIRTTVNNPKFGAECTCEIPAFGILRQMVLKTTISYRIKDTDTTPLFAKAMFAQLIDQVAIKNSSRELQVIYGDCLKYAVYNLGPEESKKWRLVGKDNLVLADPSTLANTATDAIYHRRPSTVVKSTHSNDYTMDIYTVLPFSMFSGFGTDKSTPFKNLLNTRFAERLNCAIRYNPRLEVLEGGAAVDAATGFTTEPTISASELICCFDVIQDKELSQIEASNYSLSQPLALVLGNWNKRQSTFTAGGAGDNTFEVQLFNTDLAHSILITCKKVNTAVHKQKLCTGINLKASDATAGAEPCAANAQFTDGYSTVKSGLLATVDANADTVTAGMGTVVARLHKPNPIVNKHCIPHDCAIGAFDTLDEGRGCSRMGADLQTLSSIKLTSAGRELYRADNHEEALYIGNSDMKGNCWFDNHNGIIVGEDADLQDQNGCSPYNMYKIQFGDDHNTDAIRGMLSMKNLNSVKLEVTVPNCVAAGQYQVNVYVQKYSAISIESSSGRINTAVST